MVLFDTGVQVTSCNQCDTHASLRNVFLLHACTCCMCSGSTGVNQWANREGGGPERRSQAISVHRADGGHLPGASTLGGMTIGRRPQDRKIFGDVPVFQGVVLVQLA